MLLVLFVSILMIMVGGVLVMNYSNKPDPFAEVTTEYEELNTRNELHKVTLSGGCFWCMEGPFESMEGVAAVIAGYAGGEEIDPTYKEVISGKTGHRESVQIFYDPKAASFSGILDNYWWQIDPTDPDGQFADKGKHYTTVIFYHDEEQKQEAERQIEELNSSGRYDEPIVTQVIPYSTFYPAEDYHQDFYKKSSEYYGKYKKGSGREDYINAMEEKYK